jgi:hypothetical protein
MSEEVRSAVFGNVGTILCFRISPDDAPFLQKYFEPQFEAQDLIQQHSRFFVTTMMISDEKAPAFSAKTLNLPSPANDLTSRIVSQSRQLYAQERETVEQLVRQNAGLAMDAIEAPSHHQLPPAKPKVQHQMHQLDEIEEQAKQNTNINQTVGANILQALSSNPSRADIPATGPVEPHNKRRRGKRGGRKNKKPNQNQAETQSSGQVDEQVIRLR